MWSVQLFVIALFIVSTQGGVSVHNPFNCHAEDPIRHFIPLGGTHSIYEPIRGRFIDPNVSTCTPSKLWMLVRHGARNPVLRELPELRRVTNEVHSQILQNYNRGRTSLCASDFELLRNWTFPDFKDDLAEQLIPVGWNDSYELAKRYQAAFPTILSSTYSPRDFFFQTSSFQRNVDTVEAFADSWFGPNGHEQVEFEPIPVPDVYMRPWATCDQWSNMDVLAEQKAFMDGPEYQETIVQVSAKLGLHHSNVLRTNDFNQLVFWCKYEQMFKMDYTEPSPFCAVFSVANAQVIEYAHDLEWQDWLGPGLPYYRHLKDNLMCFTLQDMLRFVNSTDPNDHKVRLFSGHASQFIYLLPFGVFDADPLLNRHNFAQQTDRVFKSSNLFGMSTNLAIVRYDCAGGDNDLLFLFNERPLQIPGCDSNGVCKQSFILQRLERYLNGNCWDIYCRNS